MNFEVLINKALKLPKLRAAIVHPVTSEVVKGIEQAKQLIVPVLVGPIHKISQAAKDAGIHISDYEIIATEHSHAAAEQAVACARSGSIDILIKGSLQTDELMHAVLDKEKGLRTSKRMSHVFIIEAPNHNKLLLLTDCAINIYPTLMTKRDIVQNAIDLAIAIGIDKPKVAILSAIEMISDKLQSTIDAAALCKMSDRQQITGGMLDGPLAFDNAISEEAARIKSIKSSVAGDADILLAPDLEAGNILAKQWQYLASAKLAGIVVGARVPIVLTSRSDAAKNKLISCALAHLYWQYLSNRVKS